MLVEKLALGICVPIEYLQEMSRGFAADHAPNPGFSGFPETINPGTRRCTRRDRYQSSWQAERKRFMYHTPKSERRRACFLCKLVCGRILYVVHRKLNERDLNKDSNKMQPILNSARNTWACVHCKQEFHEVSHVWEHKDQNQCPGVPVGVKVRLENGITGFVSARNISDKADPSGNTCRLLQPGRDQMFRVLKMDMNRLQCELSCKSSDLQGSTGHNRDRYFDEERYRKDKDEKVKAKTSQIVQTNFVKRVITHPSFHNVDFKQAELMLKDMDPGDAIVRPSAKSMDQLTVTWKVTDDIYQHINIREEKKAKVFDIGKVLYINDEAFEDLDEIIARHIQPMAGFARDIMSYKYYMENVNSEDSETIEKHLHDEKQRYSSKIPYTLTPSTKYAGKFVLSYLAQKKVRHEYLSATPQGIKFRYQLFQSTEALINWFKLNYMHRPEMFKK
ncbi:SH2 domain-containing protein [Ditylenchus destructor]|uniref:SH2 domain-containing protein n=1 Tax=Ditylenchus destructor TaxID=166010 RepID=A0AAD4RDT6_9BILA|nr:SH2 domain-containing protein [Ditylenchus destructor]